MDNNKFVEVYQELKFKVYGYVLYKVKNSLIAEDITSDVFLKLYKECQSNNKVLTYAQAWCYRTAYNMVIDYIRSAHYKKGRTVSELENSHKNEDSEKEFDIVDNEIETAINTEIKEEQLIHIRNALKLLKKSEREILELRYLEELPFKDISVILNIAEGATKMRFKRALSKLKHVVKENVVEKEG